MPKNLESGAFHENSKAEAIGTGFKLKTQDVEDLMAECSDAPASKKYASSSICTMENLPAYRLDPSRGGAQHALVTITAKGDETFVVDQVQLLSPQEAACTKDSLRMLLLVARQMHASARKRGGPWSDSFSPAMAKNAG